MIKKILSFTVALSLIISFLPVVYAKNNPEIKTIYDNEEILKSLELLPKKGLEIVDGKYISRGDYIYITAKLAGLSESDITYYFDVTNDMETAGYINAATAAGYIRGYENGYFAPEEAISADDAVKVAVDILGYKQLALASGSYYIIANDISLLKDTDVKFNEKLTLSNALQTIINMSYIDLMVQTEFGENITYKKQKDKTLLTENLNIYKKTGLVKSVDGICLSAEYSSCPKGIAVIGDYRFHCENCNLAPFIGKNVIVYAKYNKANDEYYLLCYTENKNYNNILSLDVNDILSVTGFNPADYSKSQITYLENDKEKTIKTVAGPVILFNGNMVESSTITNEMFKPVVGKLELNDINNDEVYEIINIKSYSNLLVDSIRTNNNKISIDDCYMNSVYIDLDEINILNITYQGKPISIDDITANDILTIAIDKSEKYIDICVTRDLIEGTATQISNNNKTLCLTINNQNYEVSKSYEHSGAGIIKLQDSGTFYLDAFGKIAGFKRSDVKGSKYGYLCDAANFGNGLEIKYKFRILNTKNEVCLYEAADNFKIETEEAVLSVAKNSNVFSVLFDEKGNVIRQVIEYELNDENYLTKITLASTKKDDSRLSQDTPPENFIYRSFMLNQKYIITPETVIFKYLGEGNDPRKFSSGSVYDMLSGGKSYPGKIYDIDNNYVGALVVSDDDKYGILPVPIYKIDKVNSPVMAIDKVYDCVDKYGSTVTMVSGATRYGRKSLKISDKLLSEPKTLSQIKSGNIIQYEINSDELGYARFLEDDIAKQEELVIYSLLFDRQNPVEIQKWDDKTIYSTNPGITTSFGTVESRYRNSFVMNFENKTTATFLLENATKVYKILPNNKIVETTGAEIFPQSKLFVRQRLLRVYEIFIMER